jgi:hypothetical protein
MQGAKEKGYFAEGGRFSPDKIKIFFLNEVFTLVFAPGYLFYVSFREEFLRYFGYNYVLGRTWFEIGYFNI